MELNPPQEEKMSTSHAGITFLKSYLGSGMLGMASAFAQGGIIWGWLTLFGVAILSAYCCIMLLRVHRSLAAKGSLSTEPSFEEVAEVVLGPRGKIIVIAALCFTQCGYAAAYVIFWAKNLNTAYPDFNPREWGLIVLPVFVLFTWMRKMTHLAIISLFGTIAILAVVGVAVGFALSEVIREPHWEAFYDFPYGTYPVFFGISVYVFEGIGLILPLSLKMQHPEQFPKLLWGVHMFVATLCSIVGTIGYMGFYTNIQDTLMQNLKFIAPDWVFYPLLCAVMFSLLLTFPVQLFPVFEIAEPRFIPYIPLPHGLAMRVVRTLLDLFVCGVAIAIPHFGLFMSLIGSMGASLLAFIIPPFLYLWAFPRTSVSAKVTFYSIAMFGAVAAVISIVVTISDLISAFNNE